MSNVLILGKGFMGTRIHEKLQQSKNITSTIYSRQELDYTDIGKLNASFLEQPFPDIIINASGYTGRPNVDACESDKESCWNMNTILPSTLQQFCQFAGCMFIHISSGCIYDGYEKEYTEEDTPNFGMFSDRSSFYSKTKHAAELLMNDLTDTYVFRIRIPFTCDNTSRNYINKLLGYDTLISLTNSITCVEEFTGMLYDMIETRSIYSTPWGVYNAVNPSPVDAEEVTTIMSEFGLVNPDWQFIDISDLDTKANRSNCTLSDGKLQSIGYGFKDTKESLRQSIEKLSKDAELSKKYIQTE
jgi:dTDP-4-dehydrorhamnose reductase